MKVTTSRGDIGYHDACEQCGKKHFTNYGCEQAARARILAELRNPVREANCGFDRGWQVPTADR